jgi:cell wall-active antibiotic response 4TMS protein YvqF/B-box zinc finger protein
MNCANHSDIAAVAFCRTCGKPLCSACTRDVRGVIYCEPCLAARLDGTAPAAGFVAPPAVYPPVGTVPRPVSGSGPNPAVAGILAGFFPFGVGAVYCSQYAKGLAHLLIFVMLIFASDHAGNWDWIFGLGIAFFYVYQIIDAVRTARALQEGQPAPDPMGLGQTFSMGEKFDAGKVPVGAIVLIGLGLLFLLHTMRIFETGLDRLWPLILVFLGAWMFYRNYERARHSCGCGRCMARCMMGPALVLTTGILFFLDSMDIAELHRTWPAWILVVGIVKLLQSSASSAGHVGPLPPSPPGVGIAPPPPPAFSNQAPPDPASSNQASSNQASSSSGEVHNG